MKTYKTVGAWGLFLGILALSLMAYHGHVTAQTGDGYLLAQTRAESLGVAPATDKGALLLADTAGAASRLAGDAPKPSEALTPVPGPPQPPDALDAPKMDGKAGSESEEVTAEELAKQAQKIADDWQALGWMGGTIGIIGFLLLLLRFKPIDNLLEEHALKQYKPYVAAGLGVLFGFLQTYITGKGWGPSIVAGLIAGIATPGLHLLLTKGNTK